MKYLCSAPFTDLLVNLQYATSCCPIWLSDNCRTPIADPWIMWNSAKFQYLRRKMLTGDKTSCLNCPRRCVEPNGDRSPEYSPIMTSGPQLIMLGDDNTCNLRCPSCRINSIVNEFNPDQYKWLMNLVTSFGPSVRLLSLSHTGDPFSSPLYRRFLQDFDPGPYPEMRLRLLTNGLLMPVHWDDSRSWHNRLAIVDQSIDGATSATYERLRLGGTWAALMRSLTYIASIRPPEWVVKFIVQRDNFRELPALVDLLEPYGVNAIYPMAIDRWHQDQADFISKDVCHPAHPDHSEWLQCLDAARSPILRDEIIKVQMSLLENNGHPVLCDPP